MNFEPGGLIDAEAAAAYQWAAPLVGGRTVLAIGLGDGSGPAELAAASDPPRSLTAFAPNAPAAERAGSHLPEDLRPIVGEIYRLPFADRRFEVVICPAELDDAGDRPALLEELARVTAEDGLLVVGGPPELVPQLEGRFEHVDAHRVQVVVSTVIGRTPPSVPVEGNQDGGRVLALCSGQPIPPLPPASFASDPAVLARHNELLLAWEERARRAEAAGSAKHWELVASREAQRRLRKRLNTLEHRPLRVLTRVLRGGPRKLGPGPPIRAPERKPEPWD